jgi:hypothetical protein
LLLLEQALALFDVPRDGLAVCHSTTLTMKYAPNKTRERQMCVD